MWILKSSCLSTLFDVMIYHRIAVNVPLSDGLLTYSHSEPLPQGMRVLVPFRNKTVVGIVWETDITPDIDATRILGVQATFSDEPSLPESWHDLLSFTSRYCHYPTGQAVFTALPQGLKETRAVEMPQPPLFYALNEAGRAQTPPPARFNKKAALWGTLLSGGMTIAALKQVNVQAVKLIEDWAEQGWIETTEAAKPVLRPSEFQLNADQQQASDEIQTTFSSFRPFLLYGITGSGKTEVYFDAMTKILAQGRQMLFLLPEINLTPQLLKRVESRFADVPTAVLHSQMAAGKRTQDYLRAMLGQAELVIGTRLTVFTPLPDVGLIVVDEEHDGSFKQDNRLRYHARDLTVWRAKQSGCPVVLGSATPSLESWHKARNGAYRLLQLTERAHTAAQLPRVDILSVGRLKLDNGFSPRTLQLLKQNFEAGGMSLVYLNRRGFAPALFCGDCGHTFGCPNCSAKMVLHQRARQLRCHHCNHREPIPFKYPDCGDQDLTAVGHGTRRVEETLRAFLPKAAVVRVGRDNTAHKNDWADLYRRIANNEIDILVGTQMLAKGHDFARLNLVIVLNADDSLYSADFRAPKRLFAELIQVSGGAGHADEPGKVLIQTQLPEHPVFAAIKTQDYTVFAENGLNEQQVFAMPPFGFQTAIRADAPHVADAMEFLNAAKKTLAPLLPASVSQFSAAPMLMVRLAERERAQIFLESTSRQDLHHTVSLWVRVLQQNHDGKVRQSVDVDAQEM